MTKQYWMYTGLALWALLMYIFLVQGVRSGRPVVSVSAVLLASPLLLAFLAVAVEGRQLGELVSLKDGAWSFLIGDTFVLTSAVAFAAVGWRTIPQEGWYVSWWWTALSAIIGLVAGWRFHVWDGTNYIKDGAANRLLSPTKIAHDFVAYPVLFGALICIGIPLLMHWSDHTWLVLACIVVWIGLVVRDGIVSPSPFKLHPGWDPVNFRLILDVLRGSP
jgi:hypothetical protein